MRYRRLGNSELQVSELALGSWLTYGVMVDRQRARACVDRALELGINFIDTANMYGRGSAESLLGKLLSSYRRDSYVLGTKVYFPMSETDRGLSRAQIRKQIDASLERLRTDYVDLYQCHRYDHDTPLEETMEAMSDVVDAGKARYIGFSEWSRRRIKAANELDHVTRFVSSQPQYSMLYRKPERKIFPLCKKLGISQIVWSPLAQGVLTGKYAPHVPPPSDSRAAGRRIRRYTDDKVLEAVQRLRPLAQRLSLSMSQLALAWVLREQSVSAAIIGASRPEQIQQNVGAVGVELDSETLREIDDVLNGVIRR
jgi:aryl-alcohol dehydrogenase-like predicted oxidoreductase